MRPPKSAQKGSRLPYTSRVAANVAAKQPEIARRTRASLINRQSWDRPNVLWLPNVFPASSYSHSSHCLSLLPLFLPALSSTASDREAAPCSSAVFCFAIAPVPVLVPPAPRAPSKQADLGTWEQPHARAPRVACLERLRAAKGEVRWLYMLSGIAW